MLPLLVTLLSSHVESIGCSRPNPKHVSSTYLKTDSQSLWYRKSLAKGKGVETSEEGTSDGRYVLHIRSKLTRSLPVLVGAAPMSSLYTLDPDFCALEEHRM